jgi:hypothetical protein
MNVSFFAMGILLIPWLAGHFVATLQDLVVVAKW